MPGRVPEPVMTAFRWACSRAEMFRSVLDAPGDSERVLPRCDRFDLDESSFFEDPGDDDNQGGCVVAECSLPCIPVRQVELS